MRSVWLAVVVIAAFSMQGQTQFFPKSSLDLRGDDFKAEWYSSQLDGLREPSLFAIAKKEGAESYRFLWLRTFHHPIAVRVDRLQSDGSWTLVTRIASGAGGYSPGTLMANTSRKLTAQEAQNLLSKIESGGFWNAPNPVEDQTGTDGSQWIVEGVKAAHYHVVDRWMPKNGPARDFGAVSCV